MTTQLSSPQLRTIYIVFFQLSNSYSVKYKSNSPNLMLDAELGVVLASYKGSPNVEKSTMRIALMMQD